MVPYLTVDGREMVTQHQVHKAEEAAARFAAVVGPAGIKQAPTPRPDPQAQKLTGGYYGIREYII